ncbi:MAG: hypothetical protein ACRC68_01545 [Clostridium sp.]
MIVAIIDRYIPTVEVEIIKEKLGCKVERTYYKLATIEALKKNNRPVVLHQRLDVGLGISEIEEIFSLATSMVLIIPEKYRESSFIEELIEKHIYNAVFEDDVDCEIIINLLCKNRTNEEAREYFCIQ